VVIYTSSNQLLSGGRGEHWSRRAQQEPRVQMFLHFTSLHFLLQVYFEIIIGKGVGGNFWKLFEL